MIIQAGIIIIAAALFIFATSIFYSAVETSVKGDPTVGAHTMGTYVDFAYASSNPIKIYHEIPSDLQGNPGYGTVLYNPQTGNLKVNKYPQDFISEFILNAGFGEVTIEEGLTVYALTKWRNNLKGLDAKYALLTEKYTKIANDEVKVFNKLSNVEKAATLGDDFPYKHEGGNKWRSKSTGKYVSNDIVQKKATLEFENEAFERAAKDSASEIMTMYTPRMLQKYSTGEASKEGLTYMSKRNFKGGEVKPLADFARTNNDEALRFMESEGSELVATMYQNGHGMEDAFEAAGKSSDDFAKYLASDDATAREFLDASTKLAAESGSEIGTGGFTAEMMQEAFKSDPEGAAKLMQSSGPVTELNFIDSLDEFVKRNEGKIAPGPNNPVTRAKSLQSQYLNNPDSEAVKSARQSFNSVNNLHTNTFKPLSGEEGKAVRKSLAGSELAQNAIKNPVARAEVTEFIVKPLAQSDSLLGKHVTTRAAQKNILGRSTHLLMVASSGLWKAVKFVPYTAPKYVFTHGAFGTLKRGGSAVLSGSKSVLSAGGKALTFTFWTAPAYVKNDLLTDTGKMISRKYSSSVGGRGVAALRAKLGKTVAKETGEKLVKSASRNLPARAANALIECKATLPPGIGPALCYAGKIIFNVGISALEYFFTYVPISHFIERSQDATTAVNQNWGEFSGHSKGKPIKVTKPNCESEPAIRNIPVVEGIYDWDLIETAKDAPGVGWLIGEIFDFVLAPVKALEALLQTPSSQPVLDEPKEYDLVENGDGSCSNSHNYLLSDESYIPLLGATSPNTVVKAPFWGCAASALIPDAQDVTPGCLTIWTALYVSMWADPELSATQLTALEGSAFFLGGPVAVVSINIYLLNPIDSTNFFPYLSKSTGMINTEDYYYIENPYVISITKEFDEEGESIVTLDKEI